MDIQPYQGSGTKITEGKTTLFIPEYKVFKGPANSKMQVFYNPAMTISRDFSVLFFSVVSGMKSALDGLAASGVRGIRIKHETDYSGEMHLNDISPVAVQIMKRNALLNGIDVIIHRKKLNSLLSNNYYDYIDIDPFGSPVEYVPQALRSIRSEGILAVTATDTGALCGSYPKACLRRYGFHNIKGPLIHETGIRGLLGYLVRQAASVDRYIEPILSQSINHYYRVHVRVKNGARKADKMLNDMGYLSTSDIGFHVLSRNDLSERTWAPNPNGPFFLGNLHETGMIKEMKARLHEASLHNIELIKKYLDLYLNEAQSPPFYFETDRLSSFLKRSSPSITSIISALMDQGYHAVRTQFSPTAFKTNAEAETILKIYSTI